MMRPTTYPATAQKTCSEFRTSALPCQAEVKAITKRVRNDHEAGGSPRLGRVLDDIVAEFVARLAQSIVLADLRIDVVLVVGGT